jgi:hypothetical protein
MRSEQDNRDKVEKTILDTGADRTIVGPGWTVFDQHDECVGKTPYYGGTGELLPTVDAITLLLNGTTLEPTGLLMCYNAVYDKDGGNTRESLISTTQMERSGIEVNAKQRCFGYLQNIIFPDKRVLDLECNGMSFWLYNRKPTKGELQTWLARKDAIYILTTKGSHTIDVKGVPEEYVYLYRRLKWTEPKLAIWQQRFCYHSANSIKKTFENTT